MPRDSDRIDAAVSDLAPDPAAAGMCLTASAVVLSRDGRVLLVDHIAYRSWVFPGGHVDDEAPDDTAIREVSEETGIAARIVHQNLTAVPGMITRPQPWMVMELDGPDYGNGNPVRRHVDFLYVALADYQPPTYQEDEVAGARWVYPADLRTMSVRADVPVVTPLAIGYLQERAYL
jgi:8-oxo-dGTP pyrophosphatase MutT (NUDIX family)